MKSILLLLLPHSMFSSADAVTELRVLTVQSLFQGLSQMDLKEALRFPGDIVVKEFAYCQCRRCKRHGSILSEEDLLE